MTSGSLWVSREISGSEALHVQSSSSFGDYMTFHHTITGAADAAGGNVTGDGDVHVNKAILNDLRVSGSSIKGADANTTHQITGSFEVSNTAVFSAAVQASEYIYHQGDLNTFIRFQADDINIQAGGVDFIKITEDGSQDITVFNEGGADVDFRVESDNQTGSIFVDAGSDMVHIQGDAFSFDGDGVLRIRPGTSNKGRLVLQSRDTTAADAPQMDFQHYTDGTLAEGDYLGEIYFRGAETETGTYYAGAAIAARVDEAAWTDGSSAAGNLSFWTTPDGSTSLSKRVEIGSDGAVEITGSLEVSTDAVVSGELLVAATISHIGDSDTKIIFADDSIDIRAGNVRMINMTEDGTQDFVKINSGNADVDFIVDGDTNDKVFHVQAAASGSGPAEMVHISGTLGPVSGSGEIHAAKFVGNNAEFSGSLSIHNIGDGARPGLTTLSISNSGSTPAITLTGGMTASHDVKVEHLYTNDLYVSGTAYGVTVDRSNYASSSDGATPRIYSPTGFETSGYLYVSGSTILGDVGATSHQVTGSFEVSGPAHFSSEVHAEGIFSADGHARLGNGPTDVVTFYNTITGSGGVDTQSSIFTSHMYTWALNTSGSSVLGSTAEDTHQVTGSLEVSGPAHFTDEVHAEAALNVDGLLTATSNAVIGGDADGADRTITFGHSTLKSVIGVDDSGDVFAINTDAAFESVNDLEINAAGLVTLGGALSVGGGDITVGADADGTDRTITFGHSTLKSIMGIDDSGDVFAINTDAAFESVNDLEINSAGLVTLKSLTVQGATIHGAASGDTHQVTGSLEVSGPAHFTDEVHAEAAFNVDGALTAASTAQIDGLLTATGGAVLGNASGDTHQVTGSFEVSGPSNFTSVVNAEGPLFVYGLLTATGNAVLGNNPADTHQVTGSFEVSGPSNFTSATAHEAGLTSTTLSASSTLSALGGAHLGGTLTMDGAGIVFNVDTNAGTVNLQVNDGAGADTAITLGKNGKVTKIGDDTPTDGQVLSWDALGGKVAWSDGTTPDMSGSDNHYTSTEFRTSGLLKVSGSSTLAGGITANGHATFNEAGADVNFRVETSVASGSFKVDGGTGDIHLGGDTVTYDHSEGSILIRPGTTDQGTLILASRDGTSADDAQLDFRRYTDGSFADGDNLGIIQFKGAETEDGTYYPAAGIMAEVDEASWSDGSSTAGRLLFFTTADGATSLSTALMIDSAKEATFYGDVTVSNADITANTLYVSNGVTHNGDTNTGMNFTTDQIDLVCGGITMLTLDETTTNAVHFFAGSGSGGGTIYESGNLKVDGDLYLGGGNIRNPVGNTMISFGTDDNIDYLAEITADVTIHTADAAQLKLVSDAGQSSVDFYGRGDSMASGDNIGALRFYGTEDDGEANSALAATMIVETAETYWNIGASLGTKMRFQVGRDASTSLYDGLCIDGSVANSAYPFVGVGTTSPDAKFHIVDPIARSEGTLRISNTDTSLATSDTIVNIRSADSTFGVSNYWIKFFDSTTGATVGTINSEVAYSTFTGQHPTPLPSGSALQEGVIIASTGQLAFDGGLSNAWVSTQVTTAAKDKAVVGVYRGFNVPAEDSYMGEDQHVYNALGEGQVLVTDQNGNIETGDYICSSDRAGHGMLQDDDLLHNYTVAKATTPIDFSTVDVDSELGFKSALVPCTYHCG